MRTLNTLRSRAARRDEAGFTLIELLVVIAILGILAGIAVFSVAGITDRGTTAACNSEVAQTKVAVQAFYAQSGSYPTAASDLDPFFDGSAPTDSASNYTAGNPPTYRTCP